MGMDMAFLNRTEMESEIDEHHSLSGIYAKMKRTTCVTHKDMHS
jgi:hypothetical protein